MGIIYTFNQVVCIYFHSCDNVYTFIDGRKYFVYTLFGSFRRIVERNSLQSLIQYLLQMGVVETHFI